MANVFDVAQYILKKSGTLTTMKLQKLLYYSQAWSLAWDGVPLFEEEFEAWANGPVCRDLYNLHKGVFSLSQIQEGDEKKLTDNQIETVDIVLDHYGDKSPHWLSELTHMERPWKETREENHCEPGEICNAVISKDLMQDYYGGLK